jgi:hypothetical protein
MQSAISEVAAVSMDVAYIPKPFEEIPQTYSFKLQIYVTYFLFFI